MERVAWKSAAIAPKYLVVKNKNFVHTTKQLKIFLALRMRLHSTTNAVLESVSAEKEKFLSLLKNEVVY